MAMVVPRCAFPSCPRTAPIPQPRNGARLGLSYARLSGTGSRSSRCWAAAEARVPRCPQPAAAAEAPGRDSNPGGGPGAHAPPQPPGARRPSPRRGRAVTPRAPSPSRGPARAGRSSRAAAAAPHARRDPRPGPARPRRGRSAPRHLPRYTLPPSRVAPSAPASAPPVTVPAVPRRGQAPGPFPPSPGGGGLRSAPESWPLPPRRSPSRDCARRRREARGVPGGRPASAVTSVGARGRGGRGRPGCGGTPRVCPGALGRSRRSPGSGQRGPGPAQVELRGGVVVCGAGRHANVTYLHYRCSVLSVLRA